MKFRSIRVAIPVRGSTLGKRLKCGARIIYQREKRLGVCRRSKTGGHYKHAKAKH